MPNLGGGEEAYHITIKKPLMTTQKNPVKYSKQEYTNSTVRMKKHLMFHRTCFEKLQIRKSKPNQKEEAKWRNSVEKPSSRNLYYTIFY